MEFNQMKICVIGCGAAGLAALRILSEEIELYPTNWEIYGFERTSNVGGVWNYDEDINLEFITPMYKDLRTNLPKEVMGYPDFPFSNKFEHSFIYHSDVMKYIKHYAMKYDLEKYIEFNSNVERVEPIIAPNKTEWKVSITNTITSVTDTRLFDVVIVANGHFEKAVMPKITGIKYFKGQFLHSKYYRISDKYANKTVFVLGAKSSGLDIAFQLSKCAKKVYLGHNYDRLMSKRYLEVIQETYGIKEINSDGLICTVDGYKYDADVIIFCTGYTVSLDFLSQSCKILSDNCFVRPLYKDLISPYYPTSLFFIGLGYEIAPFVFFYMQSKVVRAIIQKCAHQIPRSTEEMLADISSESEQFEKSNVPMRYRHNMNNKQWPYYGWCELVARDIMTFKVPKHVKYLFDLVKKLRRERIDLYREIDFELYVGNDLGFIIKCGPVNNFYSDIFDNFLKELSSK